MARKARVFAKALLELLESRDANRLAAAQRELETVAETFAQVPELGEVMTTPRIDPEKKREILKQVLSALDVSEPMVYFVQFLASRFQLQLLPSVVREFRDIVDRELGRVRASVEVASPLDEAGQRRLVEVLEKLEERKVIATVEVKPELLAGFRARVGSRVYDGSLIGQLERLKESVILGEV